MSSPGGGGGGDFYRRPSLLGSLNRPESPGPPLPNPYTSRFNPGANVSNLGTAQIPSMSTINPYRQVTTTSSPISHTLPLKARLMENETKRREDVKNKLMVALAEVETKIDSVENEIKQKTRTREKLEEEERKRAQRQADLAADPNSVVEDEEVELEPWQKVYNENRKEASKAHEKYNSLKLDLTENGLSNVSPLPSLNISNDSDYFRRVQTEIESFRPKLLAYMSHQKRLAHRRDAVLSKKYDLDIDQFKAKMEKWESSPRKRLRDTRNREQCEKVFPELKRQREAKERVSRTAQRGLDTARSEADIAELCANLEGESAKIKRMKMLACVVPRLLDAEERRYQFIDQNGRIDDPMELYRQTRDLPRWDDKSKCEFTGAFVENPKLWHKIAPRVKGKSISDCVKWYYLNKQREKYKKQVRQYRRKLPHKMPGRKPKLPPQIQDASQVQIDQMAMPSPPRTRFRQQNEKMWREDEIEMYKTTLAKFGKDWAKITNALNGLKNPQNRDEKEVKDFFDKNNRRGHKLGKIVTDARKAEKSEEKIELKKEVKKEPEAAAPSALVPSPEKEEKVEKKEVEVKQEADIVSPVTSPTHRPLISSPSLALPTVPGISPPRPKLGPDSPKPRTPPHSRPSTPKAPIELPILPGIRPSLPTTPTSPVIPARVTPAATINTSPHTPKQSVIKKEVKKEEVKVVTPIQPSSRPVGQKINSKGVFIPPVGVQPTTQLTTTPVQPGMKRKTFDTPKSPPPQQSAQVVTPSKSKPSQVIHVPYIQSPPVVTQVIAPPKQPKMSTPSKVAKTIKQTSNVQTPSTSKSDLQAAATSAAILGQSAAMMNKSLPTLSSSQQIAGMTADQQTLIHQASLGLNFIQQSAKLGQFGLGVPTLGLPLQPNELDRFRLQQTIQHVAQQQHLQNQVNQAKIKEVAMGQKRAPPSPGRGSKGQGSSSKRSNSNQPQILVQSNYGQPVSQSQYLLTDPVLQAAHAAQSAAARPRLTTTQAIQQHQQRFQHPTQNLFVPNTIQQYPHLGLSYPIIGHPIIRPVTQQQQQQPPPNTSQSKNGFEDLSDDEK